jgi:hypothetical protein
MLLTKVYFEVLLFKFDVYLFIQPMRKKNMIVNEIYRLNVYHKLLCHSRIILLLFLCLKTLNNIIRFLISASRFYVFHGFASCDIYLMKACRLMDPLPYLLYYCSESVRWGSSNVLTYMYAIILSHQDCLMLLHYQMINAIYATVVNFITVVYIA